ncbi:unnamed protein product [Parnassius mnemosyne]|uniref:Uncharacterized protein n=1 Tax=Parnassius mnemosyne TaxID=213953 RepID=A0AAV1KHL2_9NEOP
MVFYVFVLVLSGQAKWSMNGYTGDKINCHGDKINGHGGDKIHGPGEKDNGYDGKMNGHHKKNAHGPVSNRIMVNGEAHDAELKKFKNHGVDLQTPKIPKKVALKT